MAKKKPKKPNKPNKTKNDFKQELVTLVSKSLMLNGKEQSDSFYTRLGQIYLEEAPEKLYKYCGTDDYVLESLRNDTIWFSQITNLNDPFEFDVFVDTKACAEFNAKIGGGLSVVNQMKLENIIRENLVELKTVFQDGKRLVGVTCFSEVYDSTLMWSHYGNNHFGICIEYDLLGMNEELGYSPVPVLYKNAFPALTRFDLQNPERSVEEVYMKSMLIKSLDWSYEKEWRVLQDYGACGDAWDKERKGALMNMTTPSAVYLGCNADTDFEREIINVCKEKGITCYKLEKDEREYKLNRFEVKE